MKTFLKISTCLIIMCLIVEIALMIVNSEFIWIPLIVALVVRGYTWLVYELYNITKEENSND